MTAGGSQTLLCAMLFWGGGPSNEATSPVALTNVQRIGEDYVLATGPNVEGVVLLKQGRWSPEELRAFRDVPWLDAASVRVRWADLERQDQQFDFTLAEQLLAEVKRYNETHPGARRTLHLRVMGGVHVPRWFEQRHEAAYVEIYPPDLLPLDTQHRIVEAFSFPEPRGLASVASLPAGFVGFRPWLNERSRVLYQREGTITQRFRRQGPPASVARFAVQASTPEGTSVAAVARVRLGAEHWSAWHDAHHVGELPPATEAEVQATLHTDDGYVSPRVRQVSLEWRQ